MIRPTTIVTALIMSALAPLSAFAADTTSAADRSFVAMVSQGGMFEVLLGNAAAVQGSTQDIKDQGVTEAHDHGLVGDALKTAATAAGIEFPVTLNPMFQKKLYDIKAISGAGFDKAYLAEMEMIHAKDGAAFAKEATGGSSPQLKAFAVETHRIVVRHMGELKALGAAK